MPLLHLQCLKDPSGATAEIAAIAESAGIAPAALTVKQPFVTPLGPEALKDVSGLTIGGSDWSVFEPIPHYEAFVAVLKEARARRLPILGICFGAQTLARVFGGEVVRDEGRAEYGSVDIDLTEAARRDPLFSETPGRFRAQEWHHDRIVTLPKGAEALAWSQDGHMLQVFAFLDEPCWGVQFHPERSQTQFEKLLLTRTSPSPEHSIEKIRASLAPSPDATAILARFARMAA